MSTATSTRLPSSRAAALPNAEPTGAFVELDGETFYRIRDVDAMPPFLVNLVSATDLWMFVASNGAVTAGRRDADNALFPYCTQDKLFDSASTTGSFSLVWTRREGETEPRLWEPFDVRTRDSSATRCLYKNVAGSKIVFEESRRELGLVFRYQYAFCDRFGLVRTASVRNTAKSPVEIRLLDGVRNLLPFGVDQAFVSHFSNLADAYKKNELLESDGIGVFYLSSIPTDRAEPSEGLKATVAWTPDRDVGAYLLCDAQIAAFKAGGPIVTELDIRGRRCSFLTERVFALPANSTREWRMAFDLAKDAVSIETLRQWIAATPDIAVCLEREIERDGKALRCRIAEADGLQLTAKPLRDARHRSNALFNIMRGGIFDRGYTIRVSDFSDFLRAINVNAFRAVEREISSWESELRLDELQRRVERFGDVRLTRIVREYLPLTFSRRHGDPSRPWNRFSIRVRDEDGNPALAYQGNWRDIFQNWEPLGYSFPGYIESMITRFLNASTADGYNPYRVTRDGFDWETIEPDEPWSNIGYWGDHQLIYLLKLLEAAERFFPGALMDRLDEASYVYAHVPYRIRSFAAILENPRSTVDYDGELADQLLERAKSLGADGKLLRFAGSDTIATATLFEKLLVPLLAKLSNFIPDGGIWMNTQRPEWNDANNALVGNGISVVTLCYARRYIRFLRDLLASPRSESQPLLLSVQVAKLLQGQGSIFDSYRGHLAAGFDEGSRFDMLSELGQCGSDFRAELYENGLRDEKSALPIGDAIGFLDTALAFVEASISSNRRDDALYHSYNLLRVESAKRAAEIERLPEMLEGQVAVLSSGCLSLPEASALVESLRNSRLYRDDVQSYLLYPDRELPRFLEKNRVPDALLERSPVLRDMLRSGDRRIVCRDVNGVVRFNGAFRNSGDLRAALQRIQRSDSGLALDDASIAECVAVFDTVFDHRRFTGRSGTFFAYEGLGSVYWHMVSKLALAIQENCVGRASEDADSDASESLERAYFETLAGLGLEKTPGQYGAFPLDAYSHTPRHAGAQQPGMTGQVKEDLLIRWGQLGLQVENGRIVFRPRMLRSDEFLAESEVFEYVDAAGSERSITLQARQFAFTFCQTLFVVERAEEAWVRVSFSDGSVVERGTSELTVEESRSIFYREGRIQNVVFSWIA